MAIGQKWQWRQNMQCIKDGGKSKMAIEQKSVSENRMTIKNGGKTKNTLKKEII